MDLASFVPMLNERNRLQMRDGYAVPSPVASGFIFESSW